MRKCLCIICSIFLIHHAEAQVMQCSLFGKPSVSEEYFNTLNANVEAENYFWDSCSEDLNSVPSYHFLDSYESLDAPEGRCHGL